MLPFSGLWFAMFSKSSGSEKRNLNGEDGRPQKKPLSERDAFIKQLVREQKNTKVNLDDQLSTKCRFYKSTEIISVTEYAAGSSSLQDFANVMKYADDVERLKSSGLTADDIELLDAHNNGEEYLRRKYKNLNDGVLKRRLGRIFQLLNTSVDDRIKPSIGRLKGELILSTKSESNETRPMKFALRNQKSCTCIDTRPTDEIPHSKTVNLCKIRRKARALARRAASDAATELDSDIKTSSLVGSKWDIETAESGPVQLNKVYTCKSRNYYTVRDGRIVNVSDKVIDGKASDENKTVRGKLSREEIRKLPKFGNYGRGVPAKTLFVKNLAGSVNSKDLKQLMDAESNKILSIRVMKGRMKGQAFVDTTDTNVAAEILNKYNGIVLMNRPVIIQFGKAKP